MRSSPYLSKAQVGTLWNAASFSIQEYNRPMNFGLRIVGADNVKARTAELVHLLAQRFRDWVPSSPELAWMTVIVRVSGKGSETFTAAHVPPAILRSFEYWWRKRRAIYKDCNLEASLPANGQDPLRRHLRLLASICAATDPSIMVRADSNRVRLLDIVAPNLPTAFVKLPVLGRRFEIAPCIGGSAQKRAAQSGFPMISAFDEGEFGWLKRGWEQQEYADRQTARRARRKAEAIICQKWPLGQNLLVNKKREEELAQLSNNPRDRQRAWVPWWLSRTETEHKSNLFDPSRSLSLR